MLMFIVLLAPLVSPLVVSALYSPADRTPSSQSGDATVYSVKCPAGQVPVKDNPSADNSDSHTCCPVGTEANSGECLFQKYINPVVRLMAIAAGAAATLGIVMGAIQYTTSEGDPQKAARAKGTLKKSFVGFASFLFLFTFLQFMSPGGLTTRAGVTNPSAEACAKTFLGLKPWFYYLPNESFDQAGGSCDIVNFSLLGDKASGRNSDLPLVVLALTDSIVRLVGVVAVAYVIVGGIKYVVSQGEPDRVRGALHTIINALIGLALAISAAGIISFLGNRLGS